MRENEEEWLNLFYGFPYLSDIFSKKEWLTYASKFEEAYGSFEKASDALCDISAYYQYINLLLYDISNRKEKASNNPNLLGVPVIPSNKKKDDFLPQSMYRKNEDVLCLIMIISIVERLSSGKEYLTFNEWVKKTKSENVKVNKAYQSYNEEFGCSRKFRNFFASNVFLTKKEKLMLLRTVTIGIKPLFCYSEQCGEIRQICAFRTHNNCLLFNDEKALKKALSEFANFLYTLRNRFIHNACMFSLADTYDDAFVITEIPYKFRFCKKPLDFTGFLFLNLSVIELRNILNRNFKKLLNYHISNNSI